MTTNLTWYDVLGVSREASPEEIKSAWRHATDTFEPGARSGQFRMFNEAADVLLDPERRRSYDAELDAERTAQATSSSTPATAGATAAATTVGGTTTETLPPVDRTEPTGEGPDDASEPAATGDTPGRRTRRRGSRAVGVEQPARSARSPRSPRSRRPSTLQAALAAVLALLAVVAVVLAVHFGTQVRDQAREADARDEAPAAAERAAKAVLSYNYRTLPADRDRASAYLTPSFKKKYLANFAILEKQKDGSPGAAVQSKTVVAASVLGSGIVDAQPGVARVLVFVNQLSSKPGQDPQIFQNRVSMTMKQQGNRWLVDDLKSY